MHLPFSIYRSVECVRLPSAADHYTLCKQIALLTARSLSQVGQVIARSENIMIRSTFCLLSVICCCLQVFVEESHAVAASDDAYVHKYDEANSSKPIVVIGGIVPVHESANDGRHCGDITSSFQRSEAIAYAVDQVNKDPNVLPGIRLGFEVRDSCRLINVGLEQALKFISDRRIAPLSNLTYGVSGVVGASLSSVSIAVANLFQLFEVPQISFSSTAQSLSNTDLYKYFLRTVPPDNFQARALADLVAYFNWTYVVAVNSGDVYGREGIQEFIDIIESRNDTLRGCKAVAIEIPFPSTDDTIADYENAVQTLTQQYISNATVIVLFGHSPTAEGLLDAVAERRNRDPAFANQSSDLVWIGTDAWGDRLDDEHLAIAQNVLSVNPKQNSSEGFDEYFKSLHISNHSANPWFEEYWEYYFNCSLNDPTNMCDTANQHISANTGRRYKQQSAISFAIDAVNAFAHAIHNLVTEKCDSYELCNDIVEVEDGPSVIRAPLLLQYLLNVSFPGESDDLVQFDENGDKIGDYWIKNLHINEGRYEVVNIGTWRSNNDDEPVEIFGDVVWNGMAGRPESICSWPCKGGEFQEFVQGQDCCFNCAVCPDERDISDGTVCKQCDLTEIANDNKTDCIPIPVTYFGFSSALAIPAVILTCLGIIATCSVIVVLAVFYGHRIVKASSRELSGMLLAGILLCYCMPFFFMIKPSAPICAIRRFGVGFCLALCLSALVIKTIRIHRIFNRPITKSNNSLPLISPLSQVVLTLMLLLVQVAFAVVWLVAEIPSASVDYNNIHDDKTVELRCDASPYAGIGISLGYNIVLLFVATYFAFRTRKIPKNFKETKYINFTAYTLGIVWLAFIPIYFGTVSLGTTYQITSQVYAIVFSATTILSCFFIPKLYYLFLSVSGKITETSTQQQQQRKSSIAYLEELRVTTCKDLKHNGTLADNSTSFQSYADCATQTDTEE